MRDGILHILTERYQGILNGILDRHDLEEIRLRIGKPLMVKLGDSYYFVDARGRCRLQPAEAFLVGRTEFEEIFARCCRYSPYAFETELRQGFLTLPGGHRVGLTGVMVMQQDKLLAMKYFNGMNIRIAREHKGIAAFAVPFFFQDHKLCNCLILAGPGAGKTSFLRDCIRIISDGCTQEEGRNVSVLDERFEISGCYEGVPAMDLGCRSDLLAGCGKGEGIRMLLRTMNPSLIAMDELGGDDDIGALMQLGRCGVGLLATMHGDSYSSICRRENVKRLIEACGFERVVEIRETDAAARRYLIYDKGQVLLKEYEM